jgi:3-isopropylmalate dehydratase small subunit
MPERALFQGKIVAKFGDDINTDYIIPAYLLQEAWGKKYFAEHAFERYDPSFVSRCRANASKDSIVVAGKNFGCGSSREQAVYAIQYNDVSAVVAESFPDIFYRNCISNGFPALRVESTKDLEIGDSLLIDLQSLSVKNERSNAELRIYMTFEERATLLSGGRLGKVKERLRERLLATS